MRSEYNSSYVLLVILASVSARLAGRIDGSPVGRLVPYTLTPQEHMAVVDLACGKISSSDVCHILEGQEMANLTKIEKYAQEWAQQMAKTKACQREPEAWRFSYIDEVGNDVLLLEDSIDERLANVIYTSLGTKVQNIDPFEFHSGNSQLDRENMLSVAGSQVDDELCGQQLGQMLDLIEEFSLNLKLRRSNASHMLNLQPKHIKLARALDSFGRYESAHLSGRFQIEGSYEQCTQNELILTSLLASSPQREQSDPTTRMRFCWARLKLDKHINKMLEQRKRRPFEIQNTVLSVGVCLPESCHTKGFAANKQLLQQLINGQFKLPQAVYLDENLELASVFCLPDKTSRFGMPLSGKVLLVLLICWTLFAVYVTWWQAIDAANKWTRCFHLGESWRSFMCEKLDTRHNNQQQSTLVNLDALNLVKVTCCAVVVFDHSLLVNLRQSMDEIRQNYMVEKDSLPLLILGLSMVVDTFFVISAITIAYLTLNKLDAIAKSCKRQETSLVTFSKRWLVLFSIRYIRIVPMFVLAFWFKKSIFIYVGAGPRWDYGFNADTPHGACVNESWLTPFSFASAYLPLSKQCLMQAWSLSNDLFFSMFAPFLVLVMHKRFKFAAALTTTLCVASLTCATRAISLIDPTLEWELIDMRYYGFQKVANELSHIYAAPHFRGFNLTVGLLAGYALYRYEQRQHRFDHPGKIHRTWPSWFEIYATRISLLAIVSSLIFYINLHNMKLLLYPYHVHIMPQLFGSLRMLWAVANCIVFMRIMTDWQHKSIVEFSSNKFMRIFSRLNYLILLIHFDLLTLSAALTTSAQIYSHWTTLTSFATAYLYSVLIAIPVHVIFENPINRLTKFLPIFPQAKWAKSTKID